VDKFPIRIRFTTAPTNTPTANKLTVSYTRQVTDVLDDTKPNQITVHRNSLWLAAGNIAFWSTPNEVTGWELYQAEYFLDGGSKIISMLPYQDNLMVLKEAALYGFFGNQFGDAYRQKLADVGAVAPRSAVVGGNELYWVSHDGIYGWNGEVVKKLSKHVQSDIDGYTPTNTCAVFYEGWILIAFPTDSIILAFDPDTYREDTLGDGRVSFWKWTGCKAYQLVWFNGDGESKNLIGLEDDELLTFDDGNSYDTSSNPIDMIVKTRYLFDGDLRDKLYRRLKMDVSASGVWTNTTAGDFGSSTSVATISSGSGGGHYNGDISLPYSLDGQNLTIQLRNNTINTAKIYKLGVEYDRRKF